MAQTLSASERKTEADNRLDDAFRSVAENVAIAMESRATSESRLAHLQHYVAASEGTLQAYRAQFEISRRTLLDLAECRRRIVQRALESCRRHLRRPDQCLFRRCQQRHSGGQVWSLRRGALSRGGHAMPAVTTPVAGHDARHASNDSRRATCDAGLPSPEVTPCPFQTESDIHVNSALESAVTASVDDDPLRACLHVITRLHGRPVSMSALLSGMPVAGDRFAPADFVRAAAFHGYAAQVVRRRLARISALTLPATLLYKDGGACVLTRFATTTRSRWYCRKAASVRANCRWPNSKRSTAAM